MTAAAICPSTRAYVAGHGSERQAHDALVRAMAEHARGIFDFTLVGETRACEAQIATMLRVYPRAPQRWVKILRAEVIGQALHFQRTGAFPVDQHSFIQQCLGV